MVADAFGSPTLDVRPVAGAREGESTFGEHASSEREEGTEPERARLLSVGSAALRSRVMAD